VAGLRLDHVNIRTSDLERAIAFYSEILGLKLGPRPDFGFPGAWLYSGEDAIVHLVGVADPPAPYRADQQLEHFALRGDDIDAFVALLEAKGVPYRPFDVPGTKITQINLDDPDGNHLHVDFTR
jgi:catechol 2,3-dioxygenase-like lactoylglutathione lyase family enzyme